MENFFMLLRDSGSSRRLRCSGSSRRLRCSGAYLCQSMPHHRKLMYSETAWSAFNLTHPPHTQLDFKQARRPQTPVLCVRFQTAVKAPTLVSAKVMNPFPWKSH